jgi:hypothetical protein
VTVVDTAVITAADNQIPSDIPAHYISSDVSPNNCVSMNSANPTIEMAACADPSIEISAMYATVKSTAATKAAAASSSVRVGKKGGKTNKD